MLYWLKLLRLPNVFTAVADVMMGYLVTRGNLQPPAHFALLVIASCLLYLSGMVLNDVFDADEDAREQPHRPIPSGRIPLKSATAAGWALLATGLLIAWYASFTTGFWRAGTVATLLAASIVLYDAVLKRTRIAPILMGACRSLNVLLGMSLAGQEMIVPGIRLGSVNMPPRLYPRDWFGYEWLIALGIGIYVVGVTIFARTDAHTSSRGRLMAGLAILLGGMGLLAAVPLLTNNHRPILVARNGWYLLWGTLALITGWRCLSAVTQPSAKRVQAAVRHCVQSIIVLDAAVTVGYAGPFWGMIVLMLLLPTIALTMWLDAT